MSFRPGFDSLGFAVGSVTGLRWWDLTDDGLLRGTWGNWHPGENIAVCKNSAGHDVPDDDCGCGFWAYWLPALTSEVGGNRPVLGIIEGYGTTLIGEQGFRCAKARLIALTCAFRVTRPDPDWKPPPPPPPGHYQPSERLFHRGPCGMDTYRAITGALVYPSSSEPPQIEDPDQLLTIMNLLEEAYDVPVYGRLEAMTARHPVTTEYLPRVRGENPIAAAARALGTWTPV